MNALEMQSDNETAGKISQDALKGKIHNVIQLMRHPFALRIMVWGSLLLLIILVMRLFIYANSIWRNPVGHAFVETFAVFFLGCIFYCFWVQYKVSAERRTLLAATACCGLAFAGIVHIFTSEVFFDNWRQINQVGSIFQGLWKILAAALLIMAIRTVKYENKWNIRGAGIKTILFYSGGSVVGVLAYLLINSWIVQYSHIVTASFAYSIISDINKLAELITQFCLSTIFVLIALIICVKRQIEQEDKFSLRISQFLVLIIGGQFAGFLSTNAYDLCWWVSHLIGVCALFWLLVQLAREFGNSYANAQTRIEHLEAVYHMSSRLNNTLDVRVVQLVLVSEVSTMLQARFASIMVADEDGKSLKTTATQGLPDSPLKNGEPQDIEGFGRPGFYSGHTARAFKEKRIVMADDVYTDVEFIPWKILSQHEGYAVSVPLVYQDIALGVLNLFFDSHISVNSERIKLFETLASTGAVAIANAQLYDRTIELQSEPEDTANILRPKFAA